MKILINKNLKLVLKIVSSQKIKKYKRTFLIIFGIVMNNKKRIYI